MNQPSCQDLYYAKEQAERDAMIGNFNAAKVWSWTLVRRQGVSPNMACVSSIPANISSAVSDISRR
jgi:hypothetical protein